MVTTATLIAETVLAGFQALIWFSLVIIAFGGGQNIHAADFQNWATIIAVFLFAIAYALGIVIERLASSMMGYLVGDNTFTMNNASLGTSSMRMNIMKGDINVSNYVENYRRQYRMLAATAVNFVLIALTLASAVFFHLNDKVTPMPNIWKTVSPPTVELIIIILGIMTFVDRQMQGNYRKHLRDAYTITVGKEVTLTDRNVKRTWFLALGLGICAGLWIFIWATVLR